MNSEGEHTSFQTQCSTLAFVSFTTTADMEIKSMNYKLTALHVILSLLWLSQLELTEFWFGRGT